MAEHSAGFRIYADATQFERGMAQVTRTAGDVGKKVASAFDGRAIGRTLATALGLSLTDIADKVARFWTGFSKDAEAALEAMVAATGKAADAQERALEKLRAKKQKEREEELEGIENERQILLKAAEEGRKMVAEQKADAEKIAAKEAETVQQKKLQTEEAMKAARLSEREGELAKEKLEAERKITAEKEAQVEATKTSLSITGGFNAELSDSELQKKIQNLRQQDFAASQNIGGVFTAGTTGDAFGGFRRGQLASAMAELDQRAAVRLSVRAFGEQRARDMFGGSERRFRDIIDGVSENQDLARRTADGIDKLNNMLKAGIPVVTLNKE